MQNSPVFPNISDSDLTSPAGMNGVAINPVVVEKAFLLGSVPTYEMLNEVLETGNARSSLIQLNSLKVSLLVHSSQPMGSM